jgi:hypothetical protein
MYAIRVYVERQQPPLRCITLVHMQHIYVCNAIHGNDVEAYALYVKLKPSLAWSIIDKFPRRGA